MQVPDHGDKSREEQCCGLVHSRGFFLELKTPPFLCRKKCAKETGLWFNETVSLVRARDDMFCNKTLDLVIMSFINKFLSFVLYMSCCW